MVVDCQLCGACCFSRSSQYVPLTRDDRLALRGAEHLVREEDGKFFVAMKAGRCEALRVERGRFVCSIYAQRPALCSELDRGSPACREEFLAKRHEARSALATT